MNSNCYLIFEVLTMELNNEFVKRSIISYYLLYIYVLIFWYVFNSTYIFLVVRPKENSNKVF